MNGKRKKAPGQAYLIYLDEKCVNAFRAPERCLLYLDNMNNNLEELKNNNYRDIKIPFGDSYAHFDNLHRFCLDAALVSKTFWPSHTKKKSSEEVRQNRGNQLRRLLNFSEKNAIRNRTLRDSIEHFDERLDQWTLRTKIHSQL